MATDALVSRNFAPLFSSYSEMGVSFLIDSSGAQSISLSYTTYITTLNGTSMVGETYSVVYASPTTYKVDITENQSGTTLDATAWILKDGTVVAYSYLGQNLTGSEASGIFQGLMSPFIYEADYEAIVQPFTSGGGVQTAGLASSQIGQTTVALTNYSADLPLTIQVCGGSFTLSSYAVQTGSVQGVTAPLLTLLNVGGSVTYNYHTYQINSLYLRVTSLQKA